MNDEMDGKIVRDIIKGNDVQIGSRGLPNLYKGLNFYSD